LNASDKIIVFSEDNKSVTPETRALPKQRVLRLFEIIEAVTVLLHITESESFRGLASPTNAGEATKRT
jgi:hypothetical protein